MLSLTVGTSPETYAFDGRSGDIDLLLWPVNFSLAYVGYSVLSPFIAYGVEAGLRYSDESVVTARLKRIEEDLAARIRPARPAPGNSVQPHGGVGRGRAHQTQRGCPFAVYQKEAIAGAGVVRTAGAVG